MEDFMKPWKAAKIYFCRFLRVKISYSRLAFYILPEKMYSSKPNMAMCYLVLSSKEKQNRIAQTSAEFKIDTNMRRFGGTISIAAVQFFLFNFLSIWLQVIVSVLLFY